MDRHVTHARERGGLREREGEIERLRERVREKGCLAGSCGGHVTLSCDDSERGVEMEAEGGRGGEKGKGE